MSVRSSLYTADGHRVSVPSPIEVEVVATLLKRDYDLDRICQELHISPKRAKVLVSHVQAQKE